MKKQFALCYKTPYHSLMLDVMRKSLEREIVEGKLNLEIERKKPLPMFKEYTDTIWKMLVDTGTFEILRFSYGLFDSTPRTIYEIAQLREITEEEAKARTVAALDTLAKPDNYRRLAMACPLFPFQLQGLISAHKKILHDLKIIGDLNKLI